VPNLQLSHIETEAERLASFEVMRELRPHLTDSNAFVAQLARQAESGYRLLAAWLGDTVVGLAGYRFQENLLYGRFVYVDDLVVHHKARSQRLGERLLDAVRDEARRVGCHRLLLDTGLANALAQRFYFRQGLLATGLHFGQPLETA
jgi:GNAT superfamily N-acetyltransferase